MVVAPCASQRQAEHDLAGRVQRVLDDLVDVFELERAEPFRLGDETGGDHPPGIVLGRPVAGEDVAGELLVEEPVVRDVGIEGVDDVVAIEVRLGDRVIGVVAGGVGVAGQVEPVPAPALAVMGRGEQLVDEALVGIGPLSATNASTRSGVGGSPIRSNVARRIKVILSPAGRVGARDAVAGRDESIDRRRSAQPVGSPGGET